MFEWDDDADCGDGDGGQASPISWKRVMKIFQRSWLSVVKRSNVQHSNRPNPIVNDPTKSTYKQRKHSPQNTWLQFCFNQKGRRKPEPMQGAWLLENMDPWAWTKAIWSK